MPPLRHVTLALPWNPDDKKVRRSETLESRRQLDLISATHSSVCSDVMVVNQRPVMWRWRMQTVHKCSLLYCHTTTD